MTETSQELEPITPYAPPYWEERAWSIIGEADDWEQWALAALRFGFEAELEDAIRDLEATAYPTWANPGTPAKRVPVFRFEHDLTRHMLELTR